MDVGSVVRQSDPALVEAAEGAAPEDAAASSTPHTTAAAAAAGGPTVASALAALAQSTGAAAPPTVPGTRADHNAETAALQPFVRPPPAVNEAPRPAAGEQPMVQPNAAGFALPADQLVPAMLSSLQVDPSAAWPLVAQAFVAPPPAARPKTMAPPPAPAESPPVPEDAVVDDTATRVGERENGIEVEDAPEEDWCVPLVRALRAALAAPVPPPSLLAAAEQWRRGRCVVLACPQGHDPTGAAWAFVLWPRARVARRLDLRGTRVDARLHWAGLPPPATWCHVRVVKEHHPSRGRQLIPLEAMAGAAVACEVQLGPVLARALRWSVACLRVDAVRRFWGALGAQWSATVVVCSRPLAGEETPC